MQTTLGNHHRPSLDSPNWEVGMAWKQGYVASGTKDLNHTVSYNLSSVATTLSTPRKRAHLRMAPKFMGSCGSVEHAVLQSHAHWAATGAASFPGQ